MCLYVRLFRCPWSGKVLDPLELQGEPPVGSRTQIPVPAGAASTLNQWPTSSAPFVHLKNMDSLITSKYMKTIQLFNNNCTASNCVVFKVLSHLSVLCGLSSWFMWLFSSWSWIVAWLVECLPSVHEGFIPGACCINWEWWCIPVIPAKFQGHSQLQIQFEANLCYVRTLSQNNNRPEQMAPWKRALTILAQDLCWVLNTPMVPHRHL